MVFLSSRISPFTSTVILRDRSPRATAVVTSAMLRTWVVRLAASRLTLSVKSFQVPPTPGTTAWPPSRPSVPTSRATRVTSAAKERSCSTMVLRVSFSSKTSPRTSTVIFFDRSPPATAVATSAMLRTCAVKFDAMKFTLSVRSFQVPATSGTCAWPPSLPSVPTSRATRATSDAKALSWSPMVLDGVLELEDFALHVRRDLARQVAARDGGGHFGDVADLGGQVAGHRVDRVGQILPGAGDGRPVGLASEPAFGADLARHAGDFAREARDLVRQSVQRHVQLKDFPAHVDRDLARQVA